MSGQHLFRKRYLFGAIAAALVACNPSPAPSDGGPTVDTGPIGDTGPTADTGRDGGGGGSVCDSAMAVTLRVGAQSVMGDTTGHTTGLVDLGARCGGPMAGEPQAPEQVIALTFPGTASDRVAVNYTFANPGTDMMFDTTTQVRTSCMSLTGAVCFDDISATDYRSAGSITGMGGSTHYLVVSGFRVPTGMHRNVGPYQVDFTTFLNPTAPTITAGDATLLDGALLTVHVTGMDPQSSAASVQLSYLDAMGTPIAFNLGAMMANVTDLGPYNFTPPIMGMMNFMGTRRVTGWAMFPQAATATQLRVSVIDSATLRSNELTFPLIQARTVHTGAPCDATHVCPGGIMCMGTPAVCTVPPAVATLCAAAVPLTLATPTTTATSVVSTVNFTTGMGLLEGSCIGTGGMGDEHVLSLMVPTGGPFDLVAEAPPMGRMGVDTVIYDRTVCGDPSVEDGCNDDAVPPGPGHVIAAHLEVRGVAAGQHFIVADTFATQTMAASVPITVSLRPVLAAGATCDPAGVMNRCGGAAACPTTGTTHVCP